MYEVVEVFRSTLKLLERDIHGRKLHFPRLREHCEKNKIQPFSFSTDGLWTAEAKKLVPSIDEATLQMEVLEMGTSDFLKAQHKDVGNQERNRLSNAHLGQCLRIATTEYRPDIRSIASSHHSHFFD
ncbi:hypothetical protein LDENG_00265020 [Lucifuga dentata]|nr:hypothetical protein LDENG_00265020 [Lucifuga dentata]